MRIGIVAFHLFRNNKHGMDIAALELIRGLSAQKLQHTFYIFTMHGPDNRILDGIPGIKIIEMPKVPYPVAEQVLLPVLARYHKIDLLHCTSNTAPLWCSVPIVTTLHDVIFLEYSLSRYRSRYHKMANLYRKIIVPRAVKKSEKVITVSGTEVHAICQHMPDAMHKVEVISNAIASHFYADAAEDVKPDFILPRRYIFFHGNTDPKKNMDGVLQAFAQLVVSSKADYQLLLSETDDKTLSKILQRLGLMHIRSYIVAAGYIPNHQLPSVYRNALVFLYPGIRESFGLPLIEAMACGVAVITGDKSALPETAGNAALYIDSLKTNQLSDAIEFLVRNKNEREALIVKGYTRVKLFSHQQTALATMKIYESVLEKHFVYEKKIVFRNQQPEVRS
jgi:glycosyltransferase involved in cell wall biosynthesis